MGFQIPLRSSSATMATGSLGSREPQDIIKSQGNLSYLILPHHLLLLILLLLTLLLLLLLLLLPLLLLLLLSNNNNIDKV